MNCYKPGQKALRQGRVSIANQLYFVTATTIDRIPYFRQWESACLAAKCFDDAALVGDACIPAWVLMPDHAHWLIQLGDHSTLDNIVRKLKSSSGLNINRHLGRSGPLWAKGFHDRAIRKDENLKDAARYLIDNPLRAGLVQQIGDYPFWNAVWL